MRYSVRNVLAMLGTPIGRLQLRQGALFRSWPVLAALARLHRRTRVRRVRVVAVTGSLGKSTTTCAIAAALDVPLGAGSLRNAWSSLAFAVLRIRPAQRHAVVEVGIAAPGQMARYARVVQPDIAVVTAVASEHHRSLGSLEGTRVEKSALVAALPPSGVAVLNGDDPNVLWMRTRTAARVVTFGTGPACDVRASDLALAWPGGMRFDLHAFGQVRSAQLRLVGRHQVAAVLAAVAVAHVLGVPLDAALARLESLEPAAGRLSPVALGNDVVLLRDEFKSSYETVHAALDVLAEIPARRRIVVLGDISEPPGRQHDAYRAVGRRVGEIAARAVLAGGDNLLEHYRSGFYTGGLGREAVTVGGRTPQEVAEAVRAIIEPGDVVLLKGRDTQKLDRVRLLLQGRTVRCAIRTCHVRVIGCEECPMLERGWEGHAVIT